MFLLKLVKLVYLMDRNIFQRGEMETQYCIIPLFHYSPTVSGMISARCVLAFLR